MLQPVLGKFNELFDLIDGKRREALANVFDALPEFEVLDNGIRSDTVPRT
jgi:hypothetical protein